MKHPRQGVLNWFIRKIIDGEEVELYGTGKQVRDVSYIDDVVEALLLTGASKKVWGEVYNLGGIPVSLKDFVSEIIKVNKGGKFHEVRFPDNRKKIEIGDYVADYSKFTKTTGWKPKISLNAGISKTLDYYKKYKKYYW
jgi:UDP-glucose 4-epimerase